MYTKWEENQNRIIYECIHYIRIYHPTLFSRRIPSLVMVGTTLTTTYYFCCYWCAAIVNVKWAYSEPTHNTNILFIFIVMVRLSYFSDGYDEFINTKNILWGLENGSIIFSHSIQHALYYMRRTSNFFIDYNNIIL